MTLYSAEEALLNWQEIARQHQKAPVRQPKSRTSRPKKTKKEESVPGFGGGKSGRPEGKLISKVLNVTKGDMKRIAEGRAEVVVKLAKSSNNVKSMKGYMSYLSRKGELDAEDDSGGIYSGTKSLNRLMDSWVAGAEQIIPPNSDPSNYPATPVNKEGERIGKRETFNFILSMPEGTSDEAVRVAARNFAKREFGESHPYVMFQHKDEDHPHVHLTVRSQGYNGERLRFSKPELQELRKTFAYELRQAGVENANATSRMARGVVEKGVSQSVKAIDKAHMYGEPVPGKFDENGKKIRSEKKRSKLSERSTDFLKKANGMIAGTYKQSDEEKGTHTWRSVIEEKRQIMLNEYEKIAKDLIKTGSKEDRVLAGDLVKRATNLPPVETRLERVVREQVQRQDKNSQRSPDVERKKGIDI